MLNELTSIAQDLCLEAMELQQSAADLKNIRNLMGRVAELLTINDCQITGYEFK